MVAMFVMHHPEWGYAKVTERAFKGAWEAKGWKRLDPAKATKDQLAEAGDALGVTVDTDRTKTEIAESLTGDENAADAPPANRRRKS